MERPISWYWVPRPGGPSRMNRNLTGTVVITTTTIIYSTNTSPTINTPTVLSTGCCYQSRALEESIWRHRQVQCCQMFCQVWCGLGGVSTWSSWGPPSGGGGVLGGVSTWSSRGPPSGGGGVLGGVSIWSSWGPPSGGAGVLGWCQYLIVMGTSVRGPGGSGWG